MPIPPLLPHITPSNCPLSYINQLSTYPRTHPLPTLLVFTFLTGSELDRAYHKHFRRLVALSQEREKELLAEATKGVI